MPRLGAHVSTAGGLYRAILNAADLGAETIQIFGASPQRWAAPLPLKREIAEFEKARAGSIVKTVYLHAAYLVNLASAEEVMWARSVKSLSDHLKIAEAVGADGLIFHLGSAAGILPEQGIENIARGMKEVLQNVPGAAKLIMENSAGGGHKTGAKLRDIGEIFRRVDSPRVAVCFDTAHAFEAGVIERYEPAEVKALFDELAREISIENLAVVHVNDSKTAFNSHHDRHENLGQGFIGLDGFKNLFKEKRLSRCDCILEVPGFEDRGPDRRNMELLRLAAHVA